jgi:hypothetical protein
MMVPEVSTGVFIIVRPPARRTHQLTARVVSLIVIIIEILPEVS